MSSPDVVARNVAAWTKTNAEYTDGAAARAWAREEISWGVFGVPEESIGCIGEVAGLDVVELGCGTAYISAWLARRGARPVGVDPTPAQLETARRMMRETGIEFPLVEAPGESVPLPDASFDLAIREYGASLWADPVPVGTGGGAAAPSRRPADLHDELERAGARGSARREAHRAAPADAVRHVRIAVAGRGRD